VGFEIFMDFFVPTMFPVCSCKVPNVFPITPEFIPCLLPKNFTLANYRKGYIIF
jgi:hypothetical protein